MAKYHIAKATRWYQGNPYQGPSNDNQRAECDTMEEVEALIAKLTKYNGCGWRVYNSVTLEEVEGYMYYGTIYKKPVW